jgi:hypothetical protein
VANIYIYIKQASAVQNSASFRNSIYLLRDFENKPRLISLTELINSLSLFSPKRINTFFFIWEKEFIVRVGGIKFKYFKT